MKRLCALLLVIVLLCPAALAETDVEKVNAMIMRMKFVENEKGEIQ